MNLEFTIEVANNSARLIITDTTADWDAGEIRDIYDNGTATLDFIIGGVNYDTVDIKGYFAAGDQSGLVFNIFPTDLKINGQQQDGVIIDGDYVITYTVVGSSEADIESNTEYIYNLAQKGVWEELQVSKLNDFQFDNTLHEGMLVGCWDTYLKAIERAAEDENEEDFRTALDNLNVMLANRTY